MRTIPLSIFWLSTLLVSGCQSMLFTGAREGTMAVAEERPLSNLVDDTTIYTELNHYFLQSDVRDLFPHVNISVRNARVLLTGNVNAEQTKERATTVAWKPAGVQEVINEIEVTPESDFWDHTQDEWIEKNLEGRLTVTKGVNILNYSVEVVNGKAYLLGTVDSEQELNNVLQVARTARGVRQVISHLRAPDMQPKSVQGF